MNKSRIFHTSAYQTVENKIRDLLNSQPDFLSDRTAASPRAVGDAIQEILSERFPGIIGEFCSNYSADFGRRAMADLAFSDTDDFYYIVDVKTHRLDTSFNMPNLTSVERLARFYEDDKNYFILLIIKYGIKETQVIVELVHFVPIEFLSWNCLTIGALGRGQIQIANANRINLNIGYSRKQWMLELCDVLFEFYPKEIAKIQGRIEHFRKVRETWERKSEV